MGGKGARGRRRGRRYHCRPETYKWYHLTFWRIKRGKFKTLIHNFCQKLRSKKCRKKWMSNFKTMFDETSGRYVRAGTVPVDHILPVITQEYHMYLCGEPVSLTSKRYKCYKTRGVKCVKCGIEGHYFAVEKHKYFPADMPNPWHLNLYHKRKDGSEVMLTVDHIIPLAKNGSESVKNLQPMCRPCNAAKGCNLPGKKSKYPGIAKTTNELSYPPKINVDGINILV